MGGLCGYDLIVSDGNVKVVIATNYLYSLRKYVHTVVKKYVLVKSSQYSVLSPLISVNMPVELLSNLQPPQFISTRVNACSIPV